MCFRKLLEVICSLPFGKSKKEQITRFNRLNDRFVGIKDFKHANQYAKTTLQTLYKRKVSRKVGKRIVFFEI